LVTRQDLPLDLGTLTRLRALTLRGNPLRPPFGRLADARGDLAVVTSLLDGNARRVDLSECGFERLPSEVGGWVHGVGKSQCVQSSCSACARWQQRAYLALARALPKQ
jgi:hypothetical protein